MRQTFKLIRLHLVALIVLLSPAFASQAASVIASLSPLGGDSWLADFRITNNGTPPSIEGFTIYFPYGKAVDLLIVSSPSAWDTIAIQPDDLFTLPGFLDSLAVVPIAALLPGDTLAGFEATFTWLAPEPPDGLTFTVNDANFNVIEAGAVASTHLIPEPPIWMLTLLGFSLISMRRLA